jgi:small-conductance mechanosensitive channel
MAVDDKNVWLRHDHPYIGGITISLSSIMIAVFIFGIAYAVMRAVQEWLDSRLLPHTLSTQACAIR